MASVQYHGEPSLQLKDSDLEPRDKWIELGRGAFSVVYKTFCNLHNVDVAVKEIKRGNERHEIQKLVTLSPHNHVVKIKAVLEMSGGNTGIVMEFCDYGLQSLRDKLGRNFIPWPRCLLFMQHIMSGLQFLHRNNITHRDLKPENVMVTNSFTCKIADVGLAKAYHSKSNSSSNTQVFCPSGTPFYISPERWKRPTAVGTQTDDIYSCGILFYKMITNADLFYMERMAQDESFFSMLKMYVVDEKYRPETSELDKGTTLAPPIVKAVISTCWDAKPENRKTFDYWTSLLRQEIAKTYTDEVIREADEELRQLLHNNRENVYKKKSSVKEDVSMERVLEKSPSPSPGKKKVDEPDSPTHASRPPLQPLVSEEDGLRSLSIQENDFQVIVLNGLIVTSYYGLELHGSYSLTSDNHARELHFNHNNGKRITIPSKSIYSHEVDIKSDIVHLEIWAGAQNHVQPLSLSASSVWGIDRMLDDITGNTVVDECKPLRTDGNFNSPPSETPSQPLHQSHPHQSYHQSYPDHRNRHPGSTGGGTSISIGYVDKFFASGLDEAFHPASLAAPPYPLNELTNSEEMVTEDDMSCVMTDVATKYDTVGRLMNLQSQSKIIRSNYRDDVEEASYKLIKDWVQTNGSDATKKELACILYKAKLYNAAKQL